MKQLIQNMKVFRAMSGRFLTMAVVAAATLTFSAQAQTDPGQGAVVTHINRDATGWLTAVSPDGQLKLDVVLSGQGDFFRLNPDGTLSWQTADPQAPMTVSVLGNNGAWVPVWVGSGTLHETALVEQAADGSLTDTGDATYLDVQGQLTSLFDGSEWSLQVVVVEQDQEYKVLTIDFQPM